jgi:hypothetical protein
MKTSFLLFANALLVPSVGTFAKFEEREREKKTLVCIQEKDEVHRPLNKKC